MTKKDLFRIIIKLFGLLMFVKSLIIFLGQFGLFTSYGDWGGFPILLFLLSLVLVCGIIVLLVFFPDIIINIFRLDKGFDDEEISIRDINARRLIEFGVFIVGGLFILNCFAPLLVTIGYAIHALLDRQQQSFVPENLANSALYIHIVELCAGILTLSNYRSIAGFILSKNKANEA